jgi:hypothetical protein
MRPQPQSITAPPPRVFNYSLDWRFLLPMRDPKDVFILFDQDVDFSQTLEHVGIGASQQLSVDDLKTPKHNIFPVLAMPLGLPIKVGTRQRDRVAFYASLRHQMNPGGYFLLGFNGALNLTTGSQTNYQLSTPHQIVRDLEQAGFTGVKIYGAMPNLQIPEYIFELDPRALRFALQNRFRRKPSLLRFLRFLEGIMGWKSMSNFLPSYFAAGSA